MAAELTALLRDLPDEDLVGLLRLRPDLLLPVPSDLSALATRAQTRASVARAIDQLNRFQLEVLDGLRSVRDASGTASLDELLAVAAAPTGRIDPDAVRAAVGRLREFLLVHGPDDRLRMVAAVDEVLGPYPAGLGRPAAQLDEATAALVADPARLRRTLLSAPPAARAVLERLATDGPVGTVAREASGANGEPEHPVQWLISRGLLVVNTPGAVELPREIGMLLRRDTGPLGALHPEPPAPATATAPPASVDAAGAGQVLEIVQYAGALLEMFAQEPVTLLRAGGIGVRDLRRLSRATGVTEPVVALLLECAATAGLLGPVEVDNSEQLRPAEGYDSWRVAPIAARWYALAHAWLSMTRLPGRVGQRDDRDRVINVLSAQATHPNAPATRRAVLGVLASLPVGSTATTEETLALLAWHHPRRAATAEEAARQALIEAAHLGITARGGLTSYGAALWAELTEPQEPDDPLGVHAEDAGDLTKSAAILDALLPAPVDEVLVQADLTVVVPGPPEPTLAAELELVTDPESAGGASVHRVTRASVRRALDAGYTAEDVHGLFARRSRTTVPQALTYLVDDVARAHGGLRAGAARAYLRSDDQALIAQVVADRQLASLGLRRLAPTVLVSDVPPARLLVLLREAGYAPVGEDGRGAALLVRPERRRSPARPTMTTSNDPFGAPPAPTVRASTPRLLGIIEDLRHADAVAQRARRAPESLLDSAGAGPAAAQAHTEAMAVLQQAVRQRAMVWLGYVDAHGTTTRRRMRPVSMGAGYLRAEDEPGQTVYTFALHRITGAALDQ